MNEQTGMHKPVADKKTAKKSKKKKLIYIFSVIVVVILVVALSFNSILNFIVNKTMGKDLPQLTGEPEIGKWYSVDIDDAVSSDGSKWQGFFRKGSENKVVLYFYGGGFSVNDYTAARSMDVEGGFYNPRLNTGLNVMTYAIKEWGIGNSSEENFFRDWTFIGIPYCNGDFHSGTSEKEYTALDVELFNNPQDVTVHVDASLLITEDWHDIMVSEWNSPKAFSDVVTGDNITLDSLVALHQKRDNVKILFDCSLRDYNLSMAQVFFDKGSNIEMPSEIGKVEGDRFQQLLKKMVYEMQKQIPDCGIYIWNEETQKDGHLTVHTATGTKIYFDKRGEDPSIAQWLQDAVSGNIKTYGLELLEKSF